MKPHSGSNHLAVGTMSGTSFDGLDLAAAEFTYTNNRWKFSIVAAETIQYSPEWEDKLKSSPALSGEQLIELHNGYGRYTGQEISKFLKKHRLTPALIASHGHTIFHQPEKGYTFQLGSGTCIAAETGITTVADFRSGDVALGGQGAPLVPVGDRLLFPEYESCLNLGGFANISYEQNGKQTAFDICPVNFILNKLVQKMGRPFDAGGELGRSGKVNKKLLEQLNRLEFYRQPPPKSLGREWMDNYILSVVNNLDAPLLDKLRTTYEHIAFQISNAVPGISKMLVTGGGTFNTFLIEQIKHYMECEIVIPNAELIKFKEALIFAFLGLLRLLGEINCYASVTGARKNSSAGVVYY